MKKLCFIFAKEKEDSMSQNIKADLLLFFSDASDLSGR
jgi:hypothetical protein